LGDWIVASVASSRASHAQAIAAGHTFVIFLGEGFYPVNVLNTIKAVPEVCRIFCATANPTEVIVAETPGRKHSAGLRLRPRANVGSGC
jgi:adenosine/AMP kinase